MTCGCLRSSFNSTGTESMSGQKTLSAITVNYASLVVLSKKYISRRRDCTHNKIQSFTLEKETVLVSSNYESDSNRDVS